MACDDFNKRDTPSSIDNTLWESSITPDPNIPTIKEHIYLKFYTSTFEMFYERTQGDSIIQTKLTKGEFSYRMPKIRINFDDRFLQGIVTGKAMLLGNNMSLDLIENMAAF